MRKLLLTLILFLLFCIPTQAQEPYKIYLPLVFCMSNLDCLTNNWRFISPVQTTNMVLNPSAELTGNFNAVGGATVTRVTTFQKYGLNSYRVQTAANAQALEVTLSPLSNTNYYATARIRGKLPNRLGFILKGSPLVQATLLETLGDGWYLYGVRFDGARSNGSTFLRIGQIGPGSGDFYVDGIQVEAQTDYTTYCDGTQDGCAWNGVANASTSTRSGQSRAGGNIKDFFDDYGFFVKKVVGAGMVTPTVNIDPYALLPGGELNSIKLQPRTFTLVGEFQADSEQELHDNRQTLVTALSGDTFPDNQPVKLRFLGARIQKEISAYYQGGLEGDLAAFYNKTFAPLEDDQWQDTKRFVETAAIQFIAPDPMWYEVGESAVTLDTNDSATVRIIAGRLKSTGQWNPLGPPNVAGAYSTVNAIVEDSTYVYIGGGFDNWDNIAAADNVVRYNKQTGVYSALSTGLNGIVNALALAPNGDLYIGGVFTDAGGVAAADNICVWNGTSFAAVGVPNTGAALLLGVYALAFDRAGLLYVGGNFQNWNNIANADYIVSWNGTAYAALSTGGNGQVSALAIGIDNTLYVGGSFTTIGGVVTNYLASWNGTAFSAIASGDNIVSALAIDDSTGVLYIAGSFTTLGTTSASRVASWNGTAISPLGSGLNNLGLALDIGADGVVWIGGAFTTAGGLTVNRIARWNGSSFSHPDIDIPGVSQVFAILASNYVDPVVDSNYDLFVGFNTLGTATFSGLVTTTNGGSAPAFPKIIYNRSGGTTATIGSINNETNGQEILFDYSLLNGETLTIDLNPLNKSVVSSFFGPRFDAVLPNSDFGIWALQPGSQSITSYVLTTGSPTITGYLLWRDCFKSYD